MLRIDGTDLLAILARSAKPASMCPVDLFVRALHSMKYRFFCAVQHSHEDTN